MGRVALITGAAKRIGREIAYEMAKNGFDVAIHCRHAVSEARTLERELVRSFGVRCCVIEADLTQEDRIAFVLDETYRLLGGADILINNAAVFRDDDLETATREDFRYHFETNLWAPFRLMQEFARRFRAEGKKGGVIVNMCDGRSQGVPKTRFLTYTLSKSALWDLTRSAAKSLAPDIRVNAIGVGLALADEHYMSAERLQARRTELPLQDCAGPQEIAKAVSDLISLESVTGQMLNLDGGGHLKF